MKYIEALFWGILAALGALLVELLFFNLVQIIKSSEKILDLNLFFYSLPFIIVAALTEETFKYLVIAKKIEDFFIARSVIIGSILVGLSFSAVEIGLIYLGLGKQWPGFTRYMLEICLLHITTSGIIGYFVIVGNPKKFMNFVLAVFSMSVVHFIFNILALNRNYFINYLIYILLLFMVAINILNLLRINKKLAS